MTESWHKRNEMVRNLNIQLGFKDAVTKLPPELYLLSLEVWPEDVDAAIAAAEHGFDTWSGNCVLAWAAKRRYPESPEIRIGLDTVCLSGDNRQIWQSTSSGVQEITDIQPADLKDKAEQVKSRLPATFYYWRKETSIKVPTT